MTLQPLNYLKQFFFEAEPLDKGDYLPADAPDVEYIEQGDLIAWDFAACAEIEHGVVIRTRPELVYALVEFENGARRWLHLDEMRLVLKASALDIQTEVMNTSA